jgi:hypothetical protein
MKVKENFASHVLHCDICKKEGSVVDPNPNDYCKKGYKLLLKEIDNMQEMIKSFTKNLL